MTAANQTPPAQPRRGTADERMAVLVNADARVRDYAHVALILCAFSLFASENLVHYPVAVMALLGLVDMVRAPASLRALAGRRLLALFALIWIPMLIALTDAVDPNRSAKTVLLYLHFLPAAWYLMRVCQRLVVYRLVTAGVAILVLCVGLDAFAQLVWKQDIFAYPYDGKVLMGVFYPKQRLGLFLAVFAPLCLDMLRHWSAKLPPLWIVLVPFLIVILMSLKRSAWMMLVVGIGVYFLLARWHSSAARVRTRVLQLAVIAVIVVTTVALSPPLKRQLLTTAGLFSGDASEFDRASSYRLSLWRTGLDMFEDNLINGVGPRGYRTAYAHYAAADDFWMARGTRGQTHPHLLVLEVAVETGLVGLLALGVFYLYLWGLMFSARRAVVPPLWLLCAVVAWFPFNAHLAFYGSYWSTLAWLLIGIGLAALPQGLESERFRGQVIGPAPV